MECKTRSHSVRHPPRQIRVSQGSASVLGLLDGKLDVEPTTVYLMTYSSGKCWANCGFCPQAKGSLAKAELLSRVTWPRFSFVSVMNGIENAARLLKVKRVCIQALNYPDVFSDLFSIVKALKNRSAIPVSVSCQPLNVENIRLLARSGVDRIGVALDAATETLFNQLKGSGASGPYTWSEEWRLLADAIEIFGKGNVSTHLIVGLGESERDMVWTIQECVDMGVLPALFAFTPIRGTVLETRLPPPVDSYRRVQLARFLIVSGLTHFRDMCFDGAGRIRNFGVKRDSLRSIVSVGKPFLTSGCPSCNRPFYNEKPSGPFYNYPRDLRAEETAEIWNQLELG